MRTAKDWSEHDHSGFCFQSDCTHDQFIDWIKQIQLDAYRQACSDCDDSIKEVAIESVSRFSSSAWF